MRRDALRWMTVLSTMVLLPAAVVWAKGGGAPATPVPKTPPSASTPPPAITAVMPTVGRADQDVVITLLGSGFGTSDATVTFGPQGAGGADPDECKVSKPGTDGLLHCTLPRDKLTIGDAQRFIVTVGGKSSSASSATYTPLGEPRVLSEAASCGPDCGRVAAGCYRAKYECSRTGGKDNDACKTAEQMCGRVERVRPACSEAETQCKDVAECKKAKATEAAECTRAGDACTRAKVAVKTKCAAADGTRAECEQKDVACRKAEAAECRVGDACGSGDVQVHLKGVYFGLRGGPVPLVFLEGSDGKPYDCQSVLLISSSELVCYVSSAAYANRSRSIDPAHGFTVVPSTQKPPSASSP